MVVFFNVRLDVADQLVSLLRNVVVEKDLLVCVFGVRRDL